MHLDAVWLDHEDAWVAGILREGTDEAGVVVDLCPLGEGGTRTLSSISAITSTFLKYFKHVEYLVARLCQTCCKRFPIVVTEEKQLKAVGVVHRCPSPTSLSLHHLHRRVVDRQINGEVDWTISRIAGGNEGLTEHLS